MFPVSFLRFPSFSFFFEANANFPFTIKYTSWLLGFREGQGEGTLSYKNHTTCTFGPNLRAVPHRREAHRIEGCDWPWQGVRYPIAGSCGGGSPRWRGRLQPSTSRGRRLELRPPGAGPHDPPSPGLHQQATLVRFFLTKAGKLLDNCKAALFRCRLCGWRPARQLAKELA